MKPVRFRPDDKLPLLFILYLQVLSVLGLCSLAYFIQGWLGIFFVLLPYLLVAWLDHTFLTSIKAEEWFSFDTLPGKRWFIWSLLIHLFILLRVFVGTALRIPWREAWGYGLVILLLIIVGGVLLELLAYRPVLHRRVPWPRLGNLLVVGPVGVS